MTHSAQPDEERFPLVEIVRLLGEQIRESQRQAEEDARPNVLRLKECSIELGLTWNRTADGGFDIWAVKLGGQLNQGNTQTNSVVLEPISPVEVAVEVSAHDHRPG